MYGHTHTHMFCLPSSTSKLSRQFTRCLLCARVVVVIAFATPAYNLAFVVLIIVVVAVAVRL